MANTSGGAPEPVRVNGRFVHYRQTGVQRYLNEILEHAGDALDPIVPGRALRGVAAHLWEQTILRLRCRPELLWTPTCSGPIGYRPMVVTVHDLAPLEHPEWFSGKYAAWYRKTMPLVARGATHVIAVSAFTADRVANLLSVSRERISVIHNGVSKRFRPVREKQLRPVLAKYGLQGESYVLAVGTLEPRKNIRRLVQAWGLLESRSEVGDAILVLAGPEPSADIFAGAAPEAADARVRKLGFVPDEDLPALYSGAEAFAYPSLYEGFGLPVVEAMACGAPVVCSARCSLPEVAGDAALLVEPTDPGDIAAALSRLLSDPDLRRSMSRAGRRRCEDFSWADTAERTVELLRDVRERTRG